MMRTKKLIYNFIILFGDVGFIIINYLVFIIIILWPPSININTETFELLLKKIFFYLLFPIAIFSFIGIVLMISNLLYNKHFFQVNDINSRLWLRIILASWAYGAVLYYYQFFRKKYFPEKYQENRSYFLERIIIKSKNNRLFLDALFSIIIISLFLFISTWVIFLLSPIIKPELFRLSFAVYPIKFLFITGLSWMTLYLIAIADRSQRTDEEVESIDPLFVDFPYLLNIGKGLFKYYFKVLRTNAK